MKMIVTGLRKIESWVVTIAIIANVSGAIVLLALVAIMNVDVVSRNLFNAPFRGVVEVVIFSLALIVFLQLPDDYRWTTRFTRHNRNGKPRGCRQALLEVFCIGLIGLL